MDGKNLDKHKTLTGETKSKISVGEEKQTNKKGFKLSTGLFGVGEI